MPSCRLSMNESRAVASAQNSVLCPQASPPVGACTSAPIGSYLLPALCLLLATYSQAAVLVGPVTTAVKGLCAQFLGC